MRIGVFGGSFDPPHIGHIIFSIDAQEQFNLKKIIWIVTKIPSHKEQAKADYDSRLKMCEIATSPYQWIEVSDIERNISEPNYTFNTLCEMKNVLDRDKINYKKLFLMIGEDQARTLNTWFKIEKLSEMVHFIVMKRKGEENNNIKEIPFECDYINRYIDISSTELRDRVTDCADIKMFVPNGIAEFIDKENLYRNDNC